MKKVLFLCTGNSCRSQIAEAIVNAHSPTTWQAYSAGTQPSGFVHPKALQVLREIGIQHQGYSKSITEVQSIAFDYIITVCDAAAETCPLWPGSGRTLHVSFPDPALATGDEDQILTAFRLVREAIQAQILPLLT